MDKSKGSKLRFILLLWAATSYSLFLSGCGRMEIQEKVPAPLIQASTEEMPLSVVHDLAVLAIDFDPPIELWDEQEQVTLLIAVENRGLSQEKEVKVSAKLSAPHRSETLLRQSTTLTMLAPGEVQVVRFAGISNVPYRSAYQLEVEVPPVEGEWAFTDNVKIYELTIREPARRSLPPFTSPLGELG